MNRRSYSLRQRLDLASCVLLIGITWAGCVSLGLARQQRRDAERIRTLHAQERLVYELARSGEAVVAGILARQRADAEQLASFNEIHAQLVVNLQAFHAEAAQDVHEREQLDGALTWLSRYDQLVRGLVGGPADAAAPPGTTIQEDAQRLGRELLTFIEGIAAAAESRTLAGVVRTSGMQLAVMISGLLCFLIGVLIVRSLVTTPLHRMADGIESMQRTGRLVKLPVVHTNELGVVAAGVNHLSENVEEQKRRLREHIVELQRVNTELDYLANLKDDFLTTINHQLRTPLTAILEGVALLQDGTTGALSPAQGEMAQTVADNAKRLAKLIEQALDLSLLKSGRRLLKRRPDDLGVLLQQSQAAWQPLASARTIRLSCSTLPLVYMDPEAIRDVMDQLLRNALRHAPEHSEILVAAHVRDGVAEVSVQDQGPGLSPEQQAQLFAPFTHLHNSHAPGSEGSGLGLAFCQQIIDRHHGSIRADSASGQGVRVTFALPLATPRFLFDDACREAKTESEYEAGQFGLILVASPARQTLRDAETRLRANTHRGDRFVWLDEQTFAIIAVTDQMGLDAMARRLQGVVDQARFEVAMATALCPKDGDDPARLLEAARQGLGGQGGAGWTRQPELRSAS